LLNQERSVELLVCSPFKYSSRRAPPTRASSVITWKPFFESMANAYEGPGQMPSGSRLFPGQMDDDHTTGKLDEEQLLHIFKQIDTDNSGGIDVDELEEALRMLGIKRILSSWLMQATALL
ncbi:hypothetical protein FOZ62_009761, partial [Perkinsus olseni]